MPHKDPEARRAYDRERARRVRAADPERFRAQQRAHRDANRERIREQGRARKQAYRAANPELIQAQQRARKVQQKAYRDANIELVREQGRVRQQAYRALDPERVRAREQAYRARRPESVAAKSANRSARLTGAPGRVSPADVADAWAADSGCHYCGAQAFGLDHVIPLSRGGSNVRANIVRCCPPCNSAKGARTPEEWRLATAPLVEPIQQDERRGHDREDE